MGNADYQVVFDIWPAPFEFESIANLEASRWVNVPRQILIGQRCPIARSNLRDFQNVEAVFIASNYNKARYLQSSLYSLMMQSHSRVRVEMVDDLSNDDSVVCVQTFKQLMGLADDLIHLRSNYVNRGTYWIRNDVIAQNRQSSSVFFINDSDDYSSALRATLQLAVVQSMPMRQGNFFNIVRVDSRYASLPLNGEVERYGTASLCFTPELIRKVGYFQCIKKNADTEFIERVKHFEGTEALPWLRYPVLFQPFDGGNLHGGHLHLRKQWCHYCRWHWDT